MISLELAVLLHAYRDGGLTPSRLMRDVTSRLEAYGDKAVWIHRRPADELIAAGEALETVKDGVSALPLYGVPFAV